MTEVFKILSDENRLKMIRIMIENDEVCVCDFEQILGCKQANCSKHLNRMKDIGIVVDRREGKFSHYRLSETFMKEHRLLLEYIKENLENIDLTVGCCNV